MPKLHGWRDRQPFNNYDALFIGESEAAALPVSWRMFGSKNVGDFDRTNLLTPRTLRHGHDSTSLVQTWYARTNIPACPELDAFAHHTVMHLVVGEMPQRMMVLADLLRRDETSTLPPPQTPDQLQRESEDLVHYVARTMHFDRVSRNAAHRTWDDEPREVQTEDLATAQSAVNAMKVLGIRDRPVIVPVRQTISVSVDIYAQGRDALVAAIRRWWTTDGGWGIPGLWVHLAGLSTRDVG